MSKKVLTFGFIFLLILLICFVNAQNSYCCEKTTYGAYCQPETDVSKCSTAVKNPNTGETYQKAATSCESTSYCKLGTCVNVNEGLCLENTPQITCEKDGGNWYDKDSDELPQCQLGCCLLGNQAAFVTQNRCKSLSSLYGLETIFRNDIVNEFVCIASATSDAKGACVIEKDGERTCKLLTKRECQALERNSESDSGGGFINDLFGNSNSDSLSELNIEFHEGYLCSADELATNCGPRGGTTCVEYEDKVYFLDTCGNLANVYDYSRMNEDDDYWTYIQEPACNDGLGNTESRECGNCDYYSGSTCKAYRETNAPAPKYGDYTCIDLDCKDDAFNAKYGRQPQHGESWCSYTTDKNVREELENYLPGAEHYKVTCWEGEIIPEACDPGRATICNETNIIGDFKYASCISNRWQQCVDQETEETCLDSEARDCIWIEGYSVLKNDDEYTTEKQLENNNEEEVRASCVPKYPPAALFWEESGVLQCGFSSSGWVLFYEYGLFQTAEGLEEDIESGGETPYKKCKKADSANCHVLPGAPDYNKFKNAVTNVCPSLGDCGTSINYLGIGEKGTFDDYVDYGDIEKQ